MSEITSLPAATPEGMSPRSTINYTPSHIGNDPLRYLPALARDRLEHLQQHVEDLHNLCVPFGQRQEANAARMEADTRLKRLLARPQEGGFDLPDDDLRVVVARRELAERTREAKRLDDLDTARSGAWRAASSTVANVMVWINSGIPGGTTLEAIEIEPPKLLKDEDVLQAVMRLRKHGSELKATIDRISSSPFPSEHCKRRMREMVEQLAMRGAIDVSPLIERDAGIEFPTQRLQSTVYNEAQRSLAFGDVADHAIWVWLHRDALIKRLEVEIDSKSDDKRALSHAERERQQAELQTALLDIERQEAELVFHAMSESKKVEHRPEISPIALLAVELVTRPGDLSSGSSREHVYDVAQPRAPR
jgi:hypothetical protein